MSSSSKKKPALLRNWWVLLVLVVLALVIFDWDTLPPKWRESGLGKDKEISTSIEKDAKGQILKTTITEKSQSAKSIWDWLQLAGTLAVPVLLAILGYQFQRREQRRAEQQALAERERAEEKADVEREIASANLRDEALEAYTDRMAKLLLNQEYIKELFSSEESNGSNSSDSARSLGRVWTLTIMRRLQGDRKRQERVIDFLHDAGLLNLLTNVDLEGANLEGFNLRTFNLTEANLKCANLQGANLEYANLHKANLTKANLNGASLSLTNLSCADLSDANLSSVSSMYGNLNGANLSGANLSGANMISTDLSCTNLSKANLSSASLMKSGLNSADLRGANR